MQVDLNLSKFQSQLYILRFVVHPYLREASKGLLGCAGNRMVSHPDRKIPVGLIIPIFYIPMLRGFLLW
jgi:hypothetical protein